jgi:hypothetical protein
MNALHVISSEWSSLPLSKSTEKHPLLHSRITELQVHTLLNLRFEDHEIWTRNEIYALLQRAAKVLNSTASTIWPNRLSDDSSFRHHPYIHKVKEDTDE